MQPTADQTITLPFTMPDLLVGFAKGDGLAKVSASEVTLELVVKDDLLELFKSGVKEVHIPWNEIATVWLKRGWFGAKVCIRVKSLKLLADLPGCDGGEVTLHVARRDRDLAARFVGALSQ